MAVKGYPITPFYYTPPAATIAETVAARGWTTAEFGHLLVVSTADAARLLAGELPVTAPLADQLADVLGTPAYFWLELQRRYDEQAMHADEL